MLTFRIATRLWVFVGLAALMTLLSTPLAAQDIAGASDHPLVGRYEGARITFYETRGYDETRLPDRRRPRGGADLDPDTWTRELAGPITAIRYEGPGGRTALEIMRNHQRALNEAGFETVLFCRASECYDGSPSVFWEMGRGRIGLLTTWDSQIYLLAERNDAEGHVHVGILAIEERARGDRPLYAHLAVTVVEGEPMQTDRITAPRLVEADEMEAAFARDGRIAVYGIHFDFNSADLQPQSLPQITELGRLLGENPQLNVVIVGHTDSIGGFDYNLTLSQRRAQSVVEALARDHGIARARMTPAGAGMVAPVATNRTEEGRAQNRRVEIVEIVAAN